MNNNKNLTAHARNIRLSILDMIYNAKVSHMASSMGIVEILTVLYFEILKINPKKPLNKNRDIFILSKGHACSALYATLAERGFFPKEKLRGFAKDGSQIASHVTLGSLPGIESTAGSLGHGLSIAIGMMLSGEFDKSGIYVLVGDGELQEGSLWEGIMFAGFHRLNNLTLIIDSNNLQIMDHVDKIVSLKPFENKFDSFGWDTEIVDGHDFVALKKSFEKKHEKPLAIIAKTTKGKGISFMEDKVQWHGKCPNEKEYELAIQELKKIL